MANFFALGRFHPASSFSLRSHNAHGLQTPAQKCRGWRAKIEAPKLLRNPSVMGPIQWEYGLALESALRDYGAQGARILVKWVK